MDGGLTSSLMHAVEEAGFGSRHMCSGAGHDAMIVAARMPAAMLFLRCVKRASATILPNPSAKKRARPRSRQGGDFWTFCGRLFMSEIIVRGGTVVDADGRRVADVAIADGRITEVGEQLAAGGADEVDARGLLVLPGMIDVHLHFNEPGRTDSGRRGHGKPRLGRRRRGTTFFDMPLNSTPCTVNALEVETQSARRLKPPQFAISASGEG
jgi:hypothetical protein